jgi:hypothetical protein
VGRGARGAEGAQAPALCGELRWVLCGGGLAGVSVRWLAGQALVRGVVGGGMFERFEGVGWCEGVGLARAQLGGVGGWVWLWLAGSVIAGARFVGCEGIGRARAQLGGVGGWLAGVAIAGACFVGCRWWRSFVGLGRVVRRLVALVRLPWSVAWFVACAGVGVGGGQLRGLGERGGRGCGRSFAGTRSRGIREPARRLVALVRMA